MKKLGKRDKICKSFVYFRQRLMKELESQRTEPVNRHRNRGQPASTRVTET